MKLQTKFTLGLFLIISSAISLFSFALYYQVKSSVMGNAEKHLREEMDHEFNHVWLHPRDPRGLSRHADVHHKGIFLKVTERVGVVEKAMVFDTFPPWLGMPRDLDRSRYLFTSYEKQREGKYYRLEGATDLKNVQQFLRVLGGMLASGCLLVVGLTGPASYYLAGWGFRPFRRLAEETGRLQASDLSFRFPDGNRTSRDEYVMLVDSFNHLLERLDTAFGDLNLFAAKASHELKTPVAAMMAQIEKLLRRKDLDDDVRVTLGKMLAQGARLSRTTEQLLSLAHIDSRAAYLALPPQDATQILKTLMETYSPIAQQRGHAIELTSEPLRSTETALVGDSDLVATSVSNLVDNALKFAKSKVNLHYRTESNWLVIEVEDDGPGIPEARREEVIAPFTRAADLGNGQKNPGSGLGLAIVKAATVSLKGRLTLGRSKWGGLLARLSLPMVHQT